LPRNVDKPLLTHINFDDALFLAYRNTLTSILSN
jgi:hypothetical protein